MNILPFEIIQTLEMLEKKENVLLKKAAAEVEKAKEYTKRKNKKGRLLAKLNSSTCSSGFSLILISLNPFHVM